MTNRAPAAGGGRTIAFGPFRLDPAAESLRRDGEPVALRAKTWLVLRYLTERPGALVTTTELLDAVWPRVAVTPNVLTNVVGELRRALGDHRDRPRYIETVHRRGYRFVASIRRDDAADGPADDAGGAELDLASAALLAPAADGDTFVGRAAEIERLHALWQRARRGRRQVVFVTGEPGIGKTTLVDRFRAEVARSTAGARIALAPSLEQHGLREAYMPLLDAIAQLAAGESGAEVVATLRSHAPTWWVQIPWLVPEAEREGLDRSLAGAGAPRMLREGVALLERLAERAPLLLVCEDLHWGDAATIDMLGALARRSTAAALMIVGTYRPVDAIVHEHPIAAASRSLRERQRSVEIALLPFSTLEVSACLAHRFGGGELAERVAPAVERQSGGNPLFVEALAEHLVARGLVRRGAAGWTLETSLRALDIGLPDDLRSTIDAQLAGIERDDRDVLEAASVAGAEFAVLAIAPALDRDGVQVEAVCQRLAARGQLLRSAGTADWPDGGSDSRYAFVHVLYRRALYDGLAPLRRRRLHQRIGERLERGYGEQAEEIAAQLAVHFREAREPERCVRYLELAAARAQRRFAYREAMSRLEEALAQLAALPEGPARAAREADLCMQLANTTVAVDGLAHPRAASAFARAQDVYARVEAPRELFRARLGLCATAYVTGELERSDAIGRQLLATARGALAPLGAVARYYASLPRYVLGDLRGTCALIEESRRLEAAPDVPALHGFREPADVHLALALTLLGHLDRAREHLAEALAASAARSHPFLRIQVLCWAAEAYRLQRDPDAARPLLEEMEVLALDSGFPGNARVGRILAAAMDDRSPPRDRAVAVARAIAAWQRLGERAYLPAFLVELAWAQLACGEREAASQSLDAATAEVERGQRCSAAEVLRARAAVQLAAAGSAEAPGGGATRGRAAKAQGSHAAPAIERASAEEALRQAMRVARQQEARLLELRAAADLARLLRDAGRGAEARSELAPIRAWFTEGLDLPDVREATQLLAELGG